MAKPPGEDDVSKPMRKTPPKPFTPLVKGKPRRAESHKGNKVQPAHQRNRRQKGR